MNDIERGDIVLVELDPTQGSEIQKTRPTVVVSNNMVNKLTKLTTVVPITSQKVNQIRSFEVLLDDRSGLVKKSKAVILQVRTIDKSRIQNKLGRISRKNLKEIELALKLHFALE
ncbi:MAG: type II toxin-antitoxin system PemK/MazF family toxin [Pseudobdellovibrio sp.]|nr:type II toxin-antitoxin system PemK/MazF family toxin [Pseudobdellovibrio sp.]